MKYGYNTYSKVYHECDTDGWARCGWYVDYRQHQHYKGKSPCKNCIRAGGFKDLKPQPEPAKLKVGMIVIVKSCLASDCKALGLNCTQAMLNNIGRDIKITGFNARRPFAGLPQSGPWVYPFNSLEPAKEEVGHLQDKPIQVGDTVNVKPAAIGAIVAKQDSAFTKLGLMSSGRNGWIGKYKVVGRRTVFIVDKNRTAIRIHYNGKSTFEFFEDDLVKIASKNDKKDKALVELEALKKQVKKLEVEIKKM